MKAVNLLKLANEVPDYLNIYHDIEKDKLVIMQSDVNVATTMSDYDGDVPENYNIVFTLTPYLIGMLKTLKIPFYKAKRRILSAINKDLRKGNRLYDVNSNLYNVLVNEFGIRTA
jgi:hypothetical protein